MSIYLNKDSKVIVQGITGGEGTKHTALMLKAGTQVDTMDGAADKAAELAAK